MSTCVYVGPPPGHPGAPGMPGNLPPPHGVPPPHVSSPPAGPPVPAPHVNPAFFSTASQPMPTVPTSSHVRCFFVNCLTLILLIKKIVVFNPFHQSIKSLIFRMK